MSNQEMIEDLIFMLPYVVMFFIYLLFTLVVSGIAITMGYFISIKKLKKKLDWYTQNVVYYSIKKNNLIKDSYV